MGGGGWDWRGGGERCRSEIGIRMGRQVGWEEGEERVGVEGGGEGGVGWGGEKYCSLCYHVTHLIRQF